MSQKGKFMEFGEKLTLVIIIFIALFFAISPFVVVNTVGEGMHTGYVTAVDKKGIVIKNYRVYFKTDLSSSQEDMYCIPRDNILLANSAMESQKEREQVTIRYKGNIGFGIGLCEQSEIVDFVK